MLFTASGFGPVYFLGLHWNQPCKLSLIGYRMLLECSNIYIRNNNVIIKILSYIVKAFVVFGNAWVSMFAIHGGVFIHITVNIIGTLLTRESIEAFWKRLATSSDIYKDSVEYRQFHIFNALGNSVQQNCLGLLMAAGIFTVASCIGLLVGIF